MLPALLPSNQIEALKGNARYYFTGKPCKRGHIAKRYAPNGTCVVCMRNQSANWEATHPEAKRAWDKRWRKENPERKRAHAKQWYWSNREQLLEKQRRWVAANRDHHRASCREWGRKHLPAPSRPCPERCECCGELPTVNALHLDHDHKTGVFRGWLCMKCNTAIAKLGDDLDGVMKAVRYLQEVKP